MNKWFHRLENRNKIKIFKYLEKLDALDMDDGQMIEAMMKKTNYLRQFVTECVEAYSKKQQTFTQHGQEQEGMLF